MRSKWLIVLLSIAIAQGIDKNRPKFSPGPVTDYSCRQTNDKVTLAARPFITEEAAQPAFGKLNPYRHGVLPILVIVQNDSQQTLALDGMRVEFITADRERVEATPAADIRFLSGPRKPSLTPGPIPGRVPRVSRNKNPLNAWEIEGRAFSARMLPAKESASGFFYFQATYRGGSRLYVTGMREASSGKELLYFELPLDTK